MRVNPRVEDALGRPQVRFQANRGGVRDRDRGRGIAIGDEFAAEFLEGCVRVGGLVGRVIVDQQAFFLEQRLAQQGCNRLALGKPVPALFGEEAFGVDLVAVFTGRRGDEADDAFALGGPEALVRPGETGACPLDPDRAVGVGEDLGCVDGLEGAGDGAAEGGALYGLLAGARLGGRKQGHHCARSSVGMRQVSSSRARCVSWSGGQWKGLAGDCGRRRER